VFHGVADTFTAPCPCPPTATIGRVEFSVLAGNGADNGSAIYAETDGLTVENEILVGHAGTAVAVTAAPTWRYNNAIPATFAGMADPTGVDGNLATDPGGIHRRRRHPRRHRPLRRDAVSYAKLGLFVRLERRA